MSFVLLAVGILLAMAGFLTLGFGIPIKDFSFGNTLILTGTVSLCAGFLMIGVAFVVRELRRIARLLEGRGVEIGPVKAKVRPPELNEARVPLAPRPAPAQEEFAHQYAPRDTHAAVPPHAAPSHAVPSHEHDTLQGAPPWASEMRRSPAPSASHPASHPATRPGAPPHVGSPASPHTGSHAGDRDAAQDAPLDVTLGHRAHAPQIAPEPFDEPYDEPFELTPPPEPEPASPPKPSLASRFGFPSRRDGGETPAERKRVMLERNGRRTAPGISGESAHRIQDAEGAYPAVPGAPPARPAQPHPRAHEADNVPHDQSGERRHPGAYHSPGVHPSDIRPAADESTPAARATPPRDPDFEQLWPAPPRIREERPFSKSRAVRAEESGTGEFRAEESRVDESGAASVAESVAAHAAAPAEPDIEAPAPAHVVSVLKSGVVDGMAYSLYSDGSIEAHLPGGPVRFASIDALRDHLDKGG